MADQGKQPNKLNVVPVEITTEMRESYLDYAMSVIVSRALPDVRDGLKPSQRRILVAMNDLGLSPRAKFRKCAKIAGDTSGNYHPHGEQVIYPTLVRMAQDFNMRYNLVEGQGNFGSIDGDAPAAMRYTEARMSALALELLRDIEKDTVDFTPNYDNTRREPTVLPARVPNIILNGTVGIAVGMATKIPPHNLGEVMDAFIHLIDHPQATTEDLLKFVQGPDFPTGGVIYNQPDIHHAEGSGRGGVIVRGEAEIVEQKAGSYQIVITSLPYQVIKADLITKIADLVHSKKLEGIRDLRDESTTLDKIRIVVDLKSGVYPEKILNALYKNTELETTFHYNLLVLADGEPKLLSLKGILEEFLKFRQVVVERRARFDLARAEEREHILLGLKKALDNIDKVIKIIKASKDAAVAKANLIKEFRFSERQAVAILEMRLQKLAGLERQQIEDELREKQNLIKELKALLADPGKVLKVIREESVEVKEKYGDERRTKVIRHGVKEINIEDLVAEKDNVLVLTRGGYIKRTDPAEYRSQRRGGVGVVDLDTKEEDFVTDFLTANTHDDLLFFTDRGKVYQLKMYEIPEGKRATRGKSLMNFLALEGTERVTSILPMPKTKKESKDLSLFVVTREGVAKKMDPESFRDVRRSGIIAIKLSGSDELFSAHLAGKGEEIILATEKGQSIRFKESDVREMGRGAGGVAAIRLGKGDRVVGADVVSKAAGSDDFLVVAANGYGKKTKLKEYKTQRRAGSGIKTAKLTSKTGQLIKALVLDPKWTELIACSKRGQVIRLNLSEIPSLGRQTQGVRIMKPRAGDSLASLTCL